MRFLPVWGWRMGRGAMNQERRMAHFQEAYDFGSRDGLRRRRRRLCSASVTGQLANSKTGHFALLVTILEDLR